MISPNATRLSVTSISRWYSSWGLERAARRRTRWTSATNRHLLRQPGEDIAPLGVVVELVEAGAGRRQQHHVPGLGAGGSRRNGLGHVRVTAVRHPLGGQRLGQLAGGLAIQI